MRETRTTKQALQIETVASRKIDITMTRAQIKRLKQEQEEQDRLKKSSNNRNLDMQATNPNEESTKAIQAKRTRTKVYSVEKEPTPKKPKIMSSCDVVKRLEELAPQKIGRKDITLNEDPIKDEVKGYGREITFVAKCKGLDALCVCIILNTSYHEYEYTYSFAMSNRLKICRNMASYITMFSCDLVDMIGFIKKPPKRPVLFIIKPIYMDGTLEQYLKQLKKEGKLRLHHGPMLGFAISLFSILTDAHTTGFGLVDVTLKSMQVSLDRTLYFDGFRACMPLDKVGVENDKSWMDLKSLRCPESYREKDVKYSPKTDVFFASLILAELARDFKFTQPFYKINRKSKEVIFYKEAIHRDHSTMINIIESGLKFDPNKRATSADILNRLLKAKTKYLSQFPAQKKKK